MLESPRAFDLCQLGDGRMLGQDSIEGGNRVGFRIGLERRSQPVTQRSEALDIPTGGPVGELGVTDPAQEADEDLRPVDLLRVRIEGVPRVENLDCAFEVECGAMGALARVEHGRRRELRDGKVAHSRSFFAPEFEPPDWRAPFREAPEAPL